ncbi:MAG TPA: hypothetical protein VHO02_07010 [Fibrobacteria bacterium]|jgi:hypothetical protein|nr:hypothetical protein [Fibrobacteria bacterium]
MQMNHKVAAIRAILALSALPMVSCLNSGGSSGENDGPVQNLYGRFKVDLVEVFTSGGDTISPAYASLIGRVADGPTPSNLAWTDTDSSGVCRLRVPRAPFCDPGCGSAAVCVADNVCQAYPKGLDVGTVTVKGLKDTGGVSSFKMTPGAGLNYQVPVGTSLAFPPFTEGGTITVSAAGKDTVHAFTLSAKGMKPLKVLYDSITFVDGEPATLQWEAKGSSGTSSIFAQVDISHHGGLKGVIECEGPDNGQMVIPASLITKLKALGMAGFPVVELTRYVSGGKEGMSTELRVESRVNRPISIPGIVSCFGDEECGSGQVCEANKCQ